MTRLLALDTSTGWGSVALVECRPGAPPRVVAEEGSRVEGSHAERLLNRISRLLAEAGWSKTALDGYAATRGPGSFTGIRIGLGTIRGLGLATGRPCIGVNTLVSIAEAHGTSAMERVPLMDAGRGELYAARYDADSFPPVELESPWVAASGDVLARVSARGGLRIPGPGTLLERASGSARSVERLAGAAGRLALNRLSRAAAPDDALAPLYLRPPDALLKRARG